MNLKKAEEGVLLYTEKLKGSFDCPLLVKHALHEYR